MLKFEPGVFKASYETKEGKDLWDFLNEPMTVAQMETATALGRPAVEGIEEPLLENFGKAVLNDRTKQMLGRMVRQIMEHRGYVIDQQNVKITNGAPFSRATRYKRRDAMTFHAHLSSLDKRKIALTADKAGHALPRDKERWAYWKSFEGGLRGRIAFGLKEEEQARKEIANNGYYIYRRDRILHAAK